MDNYNKIKVVGKGSYGEVWLVKHKRDKKQYVLKKLDVHNASKRERHAAEQEAKLLSKLKHPNIVSYKDSFETDEGHLYIAMGYCEGGDLYARLKEQKSVILEERQIVEWFVQIAMALQYMHERNILHRDLKTQNIFLTKSKIIKVGDLGIARVLDCSSDMATTLIGTPYYMSPELFSNKPYNHKSDVWALGCCVYEMATLKHAFNAKDMNSLVYKILRGKMPNMPRQYSSELTTLIKAMLNHNPDRRPSVSRILRDSYIKQNIALFLESSRKEKDRRPSSGSESRKKLDVVDGANKPKKSSRPVPLVKVRDEDVEPLQVDPILAPISEELEDMGGSQRGNRQPQPRSSSSPSKGSGRPESKPDPGRASDRAFRPHGHNDAVLVSVKTSSPANSLRDDDPSPSRRKTNLRPEGQRSRPNSKERDKGRMSPSSSSSSLAAKDDKSVMNKAEPVAKPRPLPSRGPDPVTPRESSAEPVSSQSSRLGGRGYDAASRSAGRDSDSSSRVAGRHQESGYSSGASQDGRRNRRGSEEVDTSQPKLSARERRRERKDRETPREPMSARSVDLNREPPRLSRPPASRSEDYTNRPSSAGNRRHDNGRPSSARSHGDNGRPRSGEGKPAPRETPSRPTSASESRLRRRQPSLDNESSTSSSGEELTEVTEQKENKRNKQPPKLKPSLVGNPAGILPSSNHGNHSQPSRAPLKAQHPQGIITAVDDVSDSEGDGTGKEKEMNNFISALNTTLMMERKKKSDPTPAKPAPTDEDDDEDDDLFTDDVELAPPGGTRFIRRPPRPDPAPGAGDRRGRHGEAAMVAPVLTVESVSGQADTFNVTTGDKHEMKTMTATGRLWARITDLRKDCIRGLGVEKIKRAYEILENFDAEELEPQLVQLLGKQNFEVYAGKIWQLKFCEEAAFGLL